jgi:hypothetical protein
VNLKEEKKNYNNNNFLGVSPSFITPRLLIIIIQIRKVFTLIVFVDKKKAEKGKSENSFWFFIALLPHHQVITFVFCAQTSG